MPPKRGRGIVKSGNAGNSSKASKAQPAPVSGGPEEKKSLFPVGYKYPLTILNERCQDNGWEKADVQTYQTPNGWSFAVTLAKVNKKTGERESVRMEPRPAYTRPSAIEARHWGATYALYRFCNGMKLHLVLPPGPRDYWNELAAEHKAAPTHLQWPYAADPFSAKKGPDEQKAKLKDAPTTSGLRYAADPSGAKKGLDEQMAKFKDAPTTFGLRRNDATATANTIPEVKMATNIREAVEEIIKKGLSIYPEAGEESADQLSEEVAKTVSRQLGALGFSSILVQNAVKFLTKPSAIVANLLAVSTPLEAAIEYLVLHVPECDLPQRFLPTKNSSNPFVTSLHSGSDDLKRRWIEEKATKEAGYPANVVKECMTNTKLSDDASLIASLGKRLLGEDDEFSESSPDSTSPYDIEPTELEAYGATFVTKSELVMPLFSAPIQVHIFVSADSHPAYPRPDFIPVYLSSETVPAYVRLHLLSRLLHGAKSDTFLESGEGFCLAVMRLLEDEWEKIETEGRPDISLVLQHLLPRHDNVAVNNAPEPDVLFELGGVSRQRRTKLIDKRTSTQIRDEFLSLRQKAEYAALLLGRQQLPAHKFKDAFLSNLESHRVVVVIGETGCGKSTQLPQYILDSLILSGRGSEASIVVTQPRRLAAISVAKRVSSERLEDGSVGYAVRGETRLTEKTKLLFCTTGVALRRMASGDGLQGISHIVVDEVHERSIDSDVLLLGIKEVLKNNDNLHVVLMSATINYEKFSKYFNDAPVLEIPGFTHPVTDFYLEDIESLVRPRDEHVKMDPATQNKEQEHDTNKQSRRRNNRNRIDYQLIATVVQHITASSDKRGGILIFLPGVQEIRQCINAVRSIVNDGHAAIFPLHANLTSEEQSRVFKHSEKWKIIAATNVAETSITIDDVIYVIDTGKVKETKYDPALHLSKLEEGWISRAAGRQRRGRAGRTKPGKCYRLYSREEEDDMESFSIPEIHRTPLENVVLYVKNMYEKEDVKTLLGRAIDPPKDAAFDLAWRTLIDLGAVHLSGSMTPLGRYIAGLPADVKLAKMLILGTIFQCLDPILTVVAYLSSKPLFLSPMDKRDEANRARARFATAGSDLLTDVNAYEQCRRLRAQGEATFNSFCEQNFISTSTVQSISSLRNDFFSYLTDLGFVPHHLQPSSEVLNSNSDNTNLVKSVIFGGLWPHVARVRIRTGAQKFDQVQAGTVAREIKARDYLLYDVKDGRVFLHPGSILFDTTNWKSDFVTYFNKYQTDKVYLRDATQVPLYGLLLLGGHVTINHVVGGLNVVSSGSIIRLKAWPRIGILVNQLRRLLDAQLAKCLENATVLSNIPNRSILDAFKLLITHDGMSMSIEN